MVFVKAEAPKNPAQFKIPPFMKGPEHADRMRMIARWHNLHGSSNSDRRDRQRHFAIAKAIEIHHGQG